MTKLLPPAHDVAAEAAVVSACLLSPEALDEVCGDLRPDHFYLSQNRLIFAAALRLHTAGTPVDLVVIATELRQEGRLEQIGGTPYLQEIVNATPFVAHVAAYAEIIIRKWRTRELVRNCQLTAANALTEDIDQLIDAHEQAISNLGAAREKEQPELVAIPAKEAVRVATEAKRAGREISGYSTGFIDLDKLINGLSPGDLYVIAGRPGMGKTTLVLNIAANLANVSKGQASAFFSLEMPKVQLSARLIASDGRVPLSEVRSGNFSGENWNNFLDAADRISKIPLYLDAQPALKLSELKAKTRRIKSELKRRGLRLSVVAIDYLQIMGTDTRYKGNREQEISELSRGLKQFAKEQEVPVIALSQLNRSVETRNGKDKRPNLSDTRDSGAIEQDSDLVGFVYRDEYYFQDSKDKGVAELIVAKQRNGRTGTVRLAFEGEYTRFSNLASTEIGDEIENTQF